MKTRSCFVAVYVALALVAPAHAQIDCAAWNTEAYFEAAEVSDVTRCLQAGMDPEARAEGGLTPLHWAANFGDSETIEVLLQEGADAKALTSDGELPFDLLKDDEQLKKTDGYWKLYQARFE